MNSIGKRFLFLIIFLSILIIIAVGIILKLTSMPTPDKLAIDTDGGPDDALAIILAISSSRENNEQKKIDIVGITCSYGNSNIENVRNNVLKTLTIANTTNIPVYSGAHKPLESDFINSEYFGQDGFGDFQFEEPITAKIDDTKDAARALVDLAEKYPKQLNILSLGPLTNIARAIKLDPNFVGNVKKFYFMGGSIAGDGNMGPDLEFNFQLDPASNIIVFNSLMGVPSVLIPWEPSKYTNISWEWRENEIDALNTRVTKFLKSAERKAPKEAGWIPADSFAAAIALWPEKFIEKYLKANITGDNSGRINVNYSNSGNISVVQKINSNEFKIFLKEIISKFI